MGVGGVGSEGQRSLVSSTAFSCDVAVHPKVRIPAAD